MEKLNSEQIKEICKIQHKMVIARYLVSKMPIAYTNMDVDKLERDMKIRGVLEKCEEDMKKL